MNNNQDALTALTTYMDAACVALSDEQKQEILEDARAFTPNDIIVFTFCLLVEGRLRPLSEEHQGVYELIQRCKNDLNENTPEIVREAVPLLRKIGEHDIANSFVNNLG